MKLKITSNNMVVIPTESTPEFIEVKYNEGYGWQDDVIRKDEIEAWVAEMGEDNEYFTCEYNIGG
jgi:hypothetical protein